MVIIGNKTLRVSQQGNMSKRKTSNTPQQDSQKKLHVENPVYYGILYRHGEAEPIVITQPSQEVMLGGVAVRTQVKPEGLHLVYNEKSTNLIEKQQQVELHLQNQLDHRR